MSQPVRDGEAGVSLQLGQNYEHLSARDNTNKCFRSVFIHDWVRVATCAAADLCRGGMLSTVLRLLRVDTTLKLSLQSQDTCRWCLGCLFSTMTMSPAQPWVR